MSEQSPYPGVAPSDADKLKSAQAQQAAIQSAQQAAQGAAGAYQQADRFGDSLQSPRGGGASIDDIRKAQEGEETTLGMLRRKYGIG